MSVHIVILAAGESKRMRSAQPKVLHKLAGRPLIEYSVRLAEALTDEPPLLVVGRQAEQVQALLGHRARYVEQRERLGTGHALLQARPVLADRSGAVLVFYGDMPLLTEATMRRLLDLHASSGAVLSMLTFEGSQPRGFGRIVRGPDGQVQAIVEEADCTPEQLRIRELNPGLYCYDAAWLWPNLDRIPLSAKGEYYLTDLVGIAVAQGHPVAAVKVEDETEMLGVNTRVHLAEAEAILRQRINRRWMEAGVTLLDPATTYIEDTVEIGMDTVILPATHLRGRTRIGANCEIGPNTTVVDSQVGDHCVIRYSVVEEAVVEDEVEIGPYAHLRKGAHLARGVHVGNFGEVKNAYLGPGTKMGHFSYIGDATVGTNVNIGAGTITCNYDGVRKHRTVIEDDVFIGSDTMLVAPVTLGRGARTGAGSVVTHDVPPGTLVLGVPARARARSQAAEEPEAERSNAT
ncbi:MAG: bifunctional UDP-N-acetylglucosamine diphosphorylase/glucosamine-1-phosphate N-acetyltransferase GlmU [Anaerolineae bacterium]|nr:bifunctional UDP-N-acetylglucosamine diphosphorylase/glucosamine-1-phosphate N-acetyltransferase GlmU [Anaerolineae bacterium]